MPISSNYTIYEEGKMRITNERAFEILATLAAAEETGCLGYAI